MLEVNKIYTLKEIFNNSKGNSIIEVGSHGRQEPQTTDIKFKIIGTFDDLRQLNNNSIYSSINYPSGIILIERIR